MLGLVRALGTRELLAVAALWLHTTACTPSGGPQLCEAGWEGCGCVLGSICNVGLTCRAGRCMAPPETSNVWQPATPQSAGSATPADVPNAGDTPSAGASGAPKAGSGAVMNGAPQPSTAGAAAGAQASAGAGGEPQAISGSAAPPPQQTAGAAGQAGACVAPGGACSQGACCGAVACVQSICAAPCNSGADCASQCCAQGTCAPTALCAPPSGGAAGDGGDTGVIHSHIDGTFNGWTGESVFKLENGQYWQQTKYDYLYSYAYRPAVTITRTSTGHTMSVEGVDRSISVELLTIVSESQIAGTFTGWSGDTSFELTNGQVWQQAGPGNVTQVAVRPQALIYQKNGQTRIWVEGVDQTVAVRRVR